MKKTQTSLLLLAGLLGSTSIQASTVDSPLMQLLAGKQSLTFKAINYTKIIKQHDNYVMPGDYFVLDGLAKIETGRTDIQLTASYQIAGTFIDYKADTGQLFFKHGRSVAGVSNQMEVFLDSRTMADENDASTYTDGLKLATFDLVNDDAGGFFTQIGGKDQVKFRLSESDKQQFNLENDIYFDLNTNIQVAEIKDGKPVPFKFKALPCSSGIFACSRESGTARLNLGTLPGNAGVSAVPVPPAAVLFFSGLSGLLVYRKKNTKV